MYLVNTLVTLLTNNCGADIDSGKDADNGAATAADDADNSQQQH